MRSSALHFLPAAIIALLLLPGCDSNEEIKVYKVAKESRASGTTAGGDPHAGIPMPKDGEADPHAGIPMPRPGDPDPHAGLPMSGAPKKPGVIGDVPETWKPGRGSSMRLASYVTHGEGDTIADISLIILGGGAGGLLDNVNRWRTQVKLPAVDASELATSSEEFLTPLGPGTLVDLQGSEPADDPAKDGRIIGVLVPLAKEMWFYKMRGNPELLEREKEGFLRWVASARKPEATDEQPPAAPTPPVAAPPAATSPPVDTGGLTWTAPESWRPGPAKGMRIASFSVGDPAATPGDLSIIKLSGDGGGDLANVNRWRGQIGLPPLTAEALASSMMQVDSPAGPIAVVDCAGGEQHTLVAWFRKDDSSWFIKLTGPGAVVKSEEARFREFLKSLAFPAK